MTKRHAVVVLLPMVPVLTLLAMWWDRLMHDVATNPAPGEIILAKAIWCSSIAAILIVPIILSRRSHENGPPHSLLFVLAMTISAGTYSLGVLLWGWPRLPELFNWDLEVLGGTYLLASIGLSLAEIEAIRSLRTESRSRAAAGFGVALVCLSVATASGYLLVFVE